MGKVSNCGGEGPDRANEYQIKDYYYHNTGDWTHILRHEDPEVREMIANLAISAANNDKITYNHSNRFNFWNELKKVNYDPSAIKVDCEADCSSSTCAIVKAVGFLLKKQELQKIPDEYTYTYTMLNYFNKNNGFEVLKDKEYLKDDKKLVKGDIILRETAHVCIYVADAKITSTAKALKNIKFSITIDKPIESTNVNILLVQNNTDKSGEQTSGSFILNGYRSTVHIATENVDNKIENNNKSNNKDDDKIKEYEPYIYDGKEWQKYIITIMEEKEDKNKKEERFRYIYNKIENNQGG